MASLPSIPPVEVPLGHGLGGGRVFPAGTGKKNSSAANGVNSLLRLRSVAPSRPRGLLRDIPPPPLNASDSERPPPSARASVAFAAAARVCVRHPRLLPPLLLLLPGLLPLHLPPRVCAPESPAARTDIFAGCSTVCRSLHTCPLSRSNFHPRCHTYTRVAPSAQRFQPTYGVVSQRFAQQIILDVPHAGLVRKFRGAEDGRPHRERGHVEVVHRLSQKVAKYPRTFPSPPTDTVST